MDTTRGILIRTESVGDKRYDDDYGIRHEIEFSTDDIVIVTKQSCEEVNRVYIPIEDVIGYRISNARNFGDQRKREYFVKYKYIDGNGIERIGFKRASDIPPPVYHPNTTVDKREKRRCEREERDKLNILNKGNMVRYICESLGNCVMNGLSISYFDETKRAKVIVGERKVFSHRFVSGYLNGGSETFYESGDWENILERLYQDLRSNIIKNHTEPVASGWERFISFFKSP